MRALVVLMLLLEVFPFGSAFAPSHSVSTLGTNHYLKRPVLYESFHDDHQDNSDSLVDQNQSLLSHRLTSLRAQILEEELLHRPPNPNLDAVEFVSSLLSSLMHTDHPLPDSGYRVLIRCSAPRWREALRKSIGAPPGANEELMVSALSRSMPRPNNQFGILVDSGDGSYKEGGNSEEEEEEGEDVYGSYRLSFPRDVLDWEDGTCWLESQLRDPESGELFAILGWNLIKREEDGAWIVEWLDWQDFRDAFRPGIGREEWSRICG